MINMKFEKIQVKAYSGYKANERPVEFEFRGKHYFVAEISDRWYEGSDVSDRLDYFRVITDDGSKHLLRYNCLFDVWSVMISG